MTEQSAKHITPKAVYLICLLAPLLSIVVANSMDHAPEVPEVTYYTNYLVNGMLFVGIPLTLVILIFGKSTRVKEIALCTLIGFSAAMVAVMFILPPGPKITHVWTPSGPQPVTRGR
jgi:hypothetical protein